MSFIYGSTPWGEGFQQYTFWTHIPAITNTGGNVSFSLPGRLVIKVLNTEAGTTMFVFLLIPCSTSAWRLRTSSISLILGVLTKTWRRAIAKASWVDHWWKTSDSVLQNTSGLIGGYSKSITAAQSLINRSPSSSSVVKWRTGNSDMK